MSEPRPFVVLWADAIADSELDATAKLVAHTLRLHMRKDGRAWPSIALLARRASSDSRTVQRAIARLEAAGFLLAERSRGLRANRYQAVLSTLAERQGTNPGMGPRSLRHSARVTPAQRRLDPGTAPPEVEKYEKEQEPLCAGPAAPAVAEGVEHEHDQGLEPQARAQDAASRAAGNGSDPAFAALVEETKATVPFERGALNDTLAKLREELPDLTAEDLGDLIRRKAAAYRRTFPNRACTPSALAKHWNRVEEGGDDTITDLVARARAGRG